MKRIIFRAFVLLVTVFTAFSCSQDPYDWAEGVADIKLVNYEVTSVTANSIRIDASFSSGDLYSGSLVCHVTNLSNQQTTTYSHEFRVNGDGYVNLTGLLPNTTYLIEIIDHRFYNTNVDEKNNLMFSVEVTTAPMEAFVPQPLDFILQTSKYCSDLTATFRFEKSENLSAVAQAGIFYGTSENVTYESGMKCFGTIDGDKVTVSCNSLKEGTVYYVGAYIYTKEGVCTSPLQKITTGEFPFIAKLNTLQRASNNGNYGFTLSFTLSNIPKDIELTSVKVLAARKSYFELYGFAEREFAVNGVIQSDQSILYDYGKTLFVMFNKDYADSRLVWPELNWIDENGKSHITEIRMGWNC